MGICGTSEEDGEPKEETVETIMNKNRRCTDILFLLIFFAFMVGLFAAGIYGFANGDPRILIYGTDYQGDLCDSGHLDGLKTRYWVNPYEIMSSIPSATKSNRYNFRDVKSICLDACPITATEKDSVHWVCNYPDSRDGYGYSAWTTDTWRANKYDYFSLLNETLQKTSLQYKGPCYPVLLPTVNNYQSCTYFGTVSNTSEAAFTKLAQEKLGADAASSRPESYPLSSVVGTLSSTVSDFLSAPLAIMERYVDDFAQGWAVCLVMGFFIPVALSFMWLFILRYFTGIFAYLIVLAVNVGAILCTIFLYMKAGIIGSDAIDAAIGSDAESVVGGTYSGSYTDPSKDNEDVLKYCAIIATIFTVLFLFFSLLMLRRIAIAVAVIKVATQAIAGAPSVVFFPVVPVLASLGFGAYWVAAAVYLFSSGNIEMQKCDLVADFPPYKYCIEPSVNSTLNCHCGYKAEMDEPLQYMLLYHLFGLLWTTQFLQAMTYLVLASVFATYYFRGGTYGSDLSGWINTPVIQSMRKMSWYHSGSAALGSLMVAILQFIRIIVAYMVNKMKAMEKDNVVLKYAACCVQYCLWYLQKVIEWLNRNAYILIAIEGRSFCFSAFEAIALIFNNILTVGAVNVVGDTLLFLGKLSISLLSGFLAFLMLDRPEYTTGDNKVSSPLFIVLFVVVFAFVIAGLFMSVVEMAIDTVLLSFCKDCKLHSGKPKFAPPLLEAVLGKAGEEGKARTKARAERAADKAFKAQEAANNA
eukprot:CAMPEP_0181393730 /NCGR_PEP_ID=MMETSP1106-20121128/27352_1 /TAXON_ID=81844 /ORGANISM="Mantoniella antarctica, Strain SL-175" /LENGTH=752 /DNA_ID=CAMNT_0023515083 /DNA_START=27 /DNA_END=2285 /DNA_ORIENTATION=-